MVPGYIFYKKVQDSGTEYENCPCTFLRIIDSPFARQVRVCISDLWESRGLWKDRCLT